MLVCNCLVLTMCCVKGTSQAASHLPKTHPTNPRQHIYQTKKNTYTDSFLFTQNQTIKTNAVTAGNTYYNYNMIADAKPEGNNTLGGALLLTAQTTNTTCESFTGTIIALATGGTPPYQYKLNDNFYQSSRAFYFLYAEPYKVSVMDAAGAETSITATITNTYNIPHGIVTSLTRPLQCDALDGSISIMPYDGEEPYLFSLDHVSYNSNNVFNNLPQSWYDYYIKDANGCVGFVSQPLLFSGINYSVNGSSCGSDGRIRIADYPSGAVPYSYSLDGVNYQLKGTFENLTPGIKTVYIKDANGAVCLLGFQVIDHCDVSLTATVNDAGCNTNDGSITIDAVNGKPPYQYSLDGVSFQTNNAFSSLTPANYTVTVRDADNEIAVLERLVIKGSCLQLSVATTDTRCAVKEGIITLTATNGIEPYLYSIDDVNYQPENIFTQLDAGAYTVLVKDADGIVRTQQVVINHSNGPTITSLITPASCNNNDGALTLTAVGGTAPYTYNIGGNEDAQPGNTFTSLAAGDYVVLVKDNNNCNAFQYLMIPINNTLQTDAGADITICEGSKATLQATGVAESFTWQPAFTLNNAATVSPVATPTQTTKYFVTATTNACAATDSVTVLVNAAPLANAGGNTSICVGNTATLNGSGGLSYLWQPATYLSDATIANPVAICPAGTFTYKLTVTDGKGCKSLQPAAVIVTVVNAKVFIGNDTAVAINEPVQLMATDVSNSGFTTYQWLPFYGLNDAFSDRPVATITADAQYTITATTANGCTAKDTINLKAYKGPDIYVPGAFTPNKDGRNDVLKAIPIGIKKFEYFAVYDRLGRRVFYTSQPTLGWDGTINGAAQTAATYVWMASGIDNNNRVILRRGTATLLR